MKIIMGKNHQTGLLAKLTLEGIVTIDVACLVK